MILKYCIGVLIKSERKIRNGRKYNMSVFWKKDRAGRAAKEKINEPFEANRRAGYREC